MRIQRIQSCLAGLWAGALLSIGGLAAPALFSVLDRVAAGQGAGRLFWIESRLSLGLAMLLFLLERRRVRGAIDDGQALSAMNATVLTLLAILFVTVLGGFVLQPLIQAAKSGAPTALSFAALHGLSAALYWVKVVLALALAWRLSGR